VRASGPGRILRVVSDNDAAPEELAVTPAETLITDAPLDPNFIDDTSFEPDDEPGQQVENVVPPSPDEASS
jgi:hypothetical protein